MTDAPRAAGLRELFAPHQISLRLQELAKEIDALYGEEALVVLCVLKGAFIFCSDLVRCLRNKNIEVDFVRLFSYGNSSTSRGRVVINKDADIPLNDKHVLIVEDIVDSGRSMNFLLERLAMRHVRSLRLAALIDKHERREVAVRIDFAAFHVDRGFVVGYGLDYAERWRSLPAVCEIIAE
ncbi:MAG: hypoxanthine phosphoribosyltransferase [Desulfovibrio sp.]|nr:hypoxanthine phosphoribosyltransferase [Desulfovibrio sp.]